MLNITSGLYRSRKLEFDENNPNLRPTKNNVRNALFSIISKEIGNSIFVDMFGGTGAIGIEAISNNAKKVYFFENDSQNIKYLNKNLNNLKIEKDKFEVYDNDVLNSLKNIKEKINIIYVDPPYKKYDYNFLLDTISDSNILSENSIIIFESEFKLDFPNYDFNSKIYKYGRVYLTKLWQVKRK